MTIRAVIIGLLLGLFISVFTYFNDVVIRQTFLIGNHFPIGVFGVVLLLLVGANPVLGILRDRLGLPLVRGPLSPVELALITAIGLAACGWPSSNFYRGFTPIVAMPQHWLKTTPSWQAANVMAYVPGGSPTLGEGHVQDWSALVTGLRAGVSPDAGSFDRAIWQRLPERAQRTLRNLPTQSISTADRAAILSAINSSLIEPEDDSSALSHEALVPLFAVPGAPAVTARDTATNGLRNRLALVEHWPGVLLPPPSGEGMLVLGGQPDNVVLDTLLSGLPEGERKGLTELPWAQWWPTLRLWGGSAILLGLASLCLALIVHPQWSRRELLPYPIVRFLDEASERSPGSWLPTVATSKLFWIGLTVPVALHTLNGLHVWFEGLPSIPLTLELGGLRELFPNARQIYGNGAYFTPTLYLSVIAFAFFLSTSVSFSLGIAQMFWLMLGSFLLASGSTLDSEYLGAKKGNLVRFGGYLGITLMILYTGRHYYLSVAAGMVGIHRSGETPAYAVWAARGLVLCIVLASALLTLGGLDWWMALAFVLICVMLFLVMSRICAETGLIFMQAWWLPVGVLTALLGVEAIGPTTYIALALASVILVGDPREALMPYLTNGLKMVDRPGEGSRPGRAVPWLAIMIVVGFLVAGAVTLYNQYNNGITAQDMWARRALPTMPFDQLQNNIRQLASDGVLAQSTAASGMERIGMILPEKGAVPWTMLGLVLVVGTAAARLRLPWWPLHPVVFVVWGSFPISMFAASFLIGCLIKSAVIRTGGARSYHQIKPMMVGVIAGELFIALAWIIVGAVYFMITERQPLVYRVFPG